MAKSTYLQLDVLKIEKGRLYKGEKGTYLNCTIIWHDEPDQYGNAGFVVQNVSKEEREKGVKGAILGNVKHNKGEQKTSTEEQSNSDDLPF